jgi:DNA (cytosine-5)-methyltransferase 1
MCDLYSGPGGAALGYFRAGWLPEGVDIEPQPSYPYDFHLADAMTWPLEGYGFAHASPPCEAYSVARNLQGGDYPDLLGPTRDRLEAWGGPYVIENVPGSPIRAQVLLCGTMFGLKIHRHRYFETNVQLNLPPCDCNGSSVRQGDAFSYFGGKTHGRARKGFRSEREWAAEAGIRWSGKMSVRKAIPPVFTEWIGRQVLEQLEVAA